MSGSCSREEALHRDFLLKRTDYANANVKEYWIADPPTEPITLLVLSQSVFDEKLYQVSETVESKLLAGFFL